jgi:hypothetical protein
LQTKKRALTYGLGSLYQGWLVETWGTHATMTSAESYFDLSEAATEFRGKLYREAKEEGKRPTPMIAHALHVAFTGYEKLEPDAFADRLPDWEARWVDLMRQIKKAES